MDEEFDENQEFNEEDFEPELGVPFQVAIEKNGNKVLVDCLAGSMLEVKNVQYCPSGKDIEQDKLYAGPIFEDLDEELQNSFVQYLAELGVNDDVSFFIAGYADRKEQREYENWLKAVQAFTA
jgi:complement component 1 Q subcomponent-binding protein, mitochondrial